VKYPLFCVTSSCDKEPSHHCPTQTLGTQMPLLRKSREAGALYFGDTKPAMIPKTPSVSSHSCGRSWGLQDQQWLWQLQRFKIRNLGQNHETDCKFHLYFPMPALTNICEYGKHHEALATSRKCPHLQRGDTAEMVVSHLEGYCFSWKCLYIGRILLQRFLRSSTLTHILKIKH